MSAKDNTRYQHVLITGCGGMLGDYVYPFACAKYPVVRATDVDLNEPWLQALDVRDTDALAGAFRELEPDLVLHLAAETDCEVCEAQVRHSWEVNVGGTLDVARLCKEYGATMVFISTAAVFPGDRDEPYAESDRPSPTMVYGYHKLEAEHLVRSQLDEHFIFRAGWMMGAGPQKDKKFAAKVLKQVLAGTDIIYAVRDKQGTPAYTKDFAKNMLAVTESGQHGTYHMVCGGGAGSRYDVAREILKVCNRDDIQLEVVGSEFFDEEYFAPRPASESLINRNLNRIGMNMQRAWQDVLREYIPAEWPHAVRD